MLVKQLTATALVGLALAGPASAQSARPVAEYDFRVSSAEAGLIFKGVRKLTIEEGAELLNSLIQQAGAQERAAAEPPKPKPPIEPGP